MQGHPRHADAARGKGFAHALRHRDEYRPYARRSRQAVRRHARAHSPDRGEGVAEASASVAVGEAAEFPRGRIKSGQARFWAATPERAKLDFGPAPEGARLDLGCACTVITQRRVPGAVSRAVSVRIAFP